MFVLSNFLSALAYVLNVFLTIFYWLILVRAVVSWVNPDPYNSIVQFLYKATEPILQPIRRILPISFKIGIDISPLIAFFVILFVRGFLVRTLFDLADKMR